MQMKERNFKSTNQVIALSDEEGLDDLRGGAGYTTQVSVATTFRGSVGNAGNQETGGGLEVDIVVSRGGQTGNDAQNLEKLVRVENRYFWLDQIRLENRYFW